MWLMYFLLLAIGLLILLVLKQYTYWSSRGLDTPKYKYLFGNLWEQFIMVKNFGIIIDEAYQEFKGYNYFGFYNSIQPSIILRNPEVIGDVLVKDFPSFGDNDFEVDEFADPIMGRNPFILKGERWKVARGQVTPSFTTGKVKIMLPLLEDNSKKLIKYLEENEGVPMEAKTLASRITSENVASCAFGLDGGSFTKDQAKFLEIALELFNPTWFNQLKAFLIFLVPQVARLVKMRFFLQGTIDFLRSIVYQTITYRKENNVRRNDFLDAMGELKDKINDEALFNFDDILAHAGSFFLDGVETSANVISHALYELGKHQDIQDKLRAEINQVLTRKGDLTYENIQEMNYLDCVFKENLRKNPPLFFMTKRVTKPYVMRQMREDNTGPQIALELGTPVIIPVYALHHDEEYFPDPNRFDPGRFSEENKDKVVKYTYMPFSDGPRVCLGMKFGILQSKVALIAIVNKYKITVSKQTQEPILIDPKNFLNMPIGGYWLEFNKL